ncbi:ATP synthase regulation protein NCA2-domain-containing protein [Kockovaella imperatae]|uniref:ATP synthase regulation protein NCA2-domain-containing protein n=1 Tax=Kockovaella imperatae TaxID=4999 RepID=A0A1Y1U7K2_9TREE|nr:ATP synthase regulation protein NCA2-domain-containing protein [Kockovaella imperatae]ORX33993.1 ATP synthase regulation protein NCA2-domain-containing protein [Kockovaella imperatae]
MWFSAPTQTFASESLDFQLASISTLPINLSSQLSTSAAPNSALVAALHELSTTKPPIRNKLESVLQTLVEERPSTKGAQNVRGVDKVMQEEIVARAVTMIWKEVLDQLMEVARELESERRYWENVLNSQLGVGVYFVQTLPQRVLRALPPKDTFSVRSFTSLQTSSLFPHSPSAAISTLLSPYTLTRREVLRSFKAVTRARDLVATRIGILATRGPRWTSEKLEEETERIFGVIADVLEIPDRSDSSGPGLTVAPYTLLDVLKKDLPRSKEHVKTALEQHARPGRLTRLWFPLLFLPPMLYFTISTIGRNGPWLRQQLGNAKETIRGFFVSWVWEPLEGIGKTLRGGGEGLGVAPTTVKSDQASLERMVMDLGRDYYHLSGAELENLGRQVKEGDMDAVLKVYEKELQSPVKNALLGYLVRTLLIQVQKTKTDLSLSLLSLDHLLRSQQLTFAFVGVAPSVLILYGVGGWLRGFWRGEQRGKSRRKTYFYGLRDIERLLLVAPKKGEEMSVQDRGLLIVAVSGLRSWARGMGATQDAFLDDLRLVEDPQLSRGTKLRAVERIWRSWGHDGRQRP